MEPVGSGGCGEEAMRPLVRWCSWVAVLATGSGWVVVGGAERLQAGVVQSCLQGPQSPLDTPACHASDTNGDGDADLADVAELQNQTARFVHAPRIVAVASSPSHLSAQTGLSRIQVAFDQSVFLSADSVRAWSVGKSRLLPIAVEVDPDAEGVSIEFSSPIRADIVTLVIDYAVVNWLNRPLDGEIPEPLAPRFPSGDGRPGGQAVFRFHVLAGDVDGDGIVAAEDLNLVESALGTCVGDPLFDPTLDVDEDGCIDPADADFVASVIGSALPATDQRPPILTDLAYDGFGTIWARFSEPLSPVGTTRRACFILDAEDRVVAPLAAGFSPDGAEILFVFPSSIVCGEDTTIQLSNSLSDLSGELLPLTPPRRCR